MTWAKSWALNLGHGWRIDFCDRHEIGKIVFSHLKFIILLFKTKIKLLNPHFVRTKKILLSITCSTRSHLITKDYDRSSVYIKITMEILSNIIFYKYENKWNNLHIFYLTVIVIFKISIAVNLKRKMSQLKLIYLMSQNYIRSKST